MDKFAVINNQEECRFEVNVDNETALLQYDERNDIIVLLHTEVPDAFEGRGIGSMLAMHALEWVRSSNKRVKVRCAFVTRFMERHAEYNDLLVN